MQPKIKLLSKQEIEQTVASTEDLIPDCYGTDSDIYRMGIKSGMIMARHECERQATEMLKKVAKYFWDKRSEWSDDNPQKFDFDWQQFLKEQDEK